MALFGLAAAAILTRRKLRPGKQA
ncbi:MAG: hypothetical protein ACK57E_12415 [Erythrobacteraceae bacterium]